MTFITSLLKSPVNCMHAGIISKAHQVGSQLETVVLWRASRLEAA